MADLTHRAVTPEEIARIKEAWMQHYRGQDPADWEPFPSLTPISEARISLQLEPLRTRAEAEAWLDELEAPAEVRDLFLTGVDFEPD